MPFGAWLAEWLPGWCCFMKDQHLLPLTYSFSNRFLFPAFSSLSVSVWDNDGHTLALTVAAFNILGYISISCSFLYSLTLMLLLSLDLSPLMMMMMILMRMMIFSEAAVDATLFGHRQGWHC